MQHPIPPPSQPPSQEQLLWAAINEIKAMKNDISMLRSNNIDWQCQILYYSIVTMAVLAGGPIAIGLSLTATAFLLFIFPFLLILDCFMVQLIRLNPTQAKQSFKRIIFWLSWVLGPLIVVTFIGEFLTKHGLPFWIVFGKMNGISS